MKIGYLGKQDSFVREMLRQMKGEIRRMSF
jgi:hypothetical protein